MERFLRFYYYYYCCCCCCWLMVQFRTQTLLLIFFSFFLSFHVNHLSLLCAFLSRLNLSSPHRTRTITIFIKFSSSSFSSSSFSSSSSRISISVRAFCCCCSRSDYQRRVGRPPISGAMTRQGSKLILFTSDHLKSPESSPPRRTASLFSPDSGEAPATSKVPN